jgi:glycosyltransferase involved in cell wall biosynthesis
MSSFAEVNLSIIIPCFNGWKYITKCLNILESQTKLPFEVIIVDDCSTDDSYVKLQEYAENTKLNLVLLKNPTNFGPGKSRKTGIEAATGNYLAFCDCDDWYEQDFVYDISNAILEQEADLILFDNYVSFEDGKRYRQNRTKGKEFADKKDLIIESNLSLCRLTASAQLFKTVVHVDLHHEEDSVLVIQLLEQSNKIYILDKAYYNYFFRDGSLSKKDSPQIYKDEISAFGYIKNFLNVKYKKETEYIGIRYVCYSAVLYAFRAGIKLTDIKKFISTFEIEYPHWFNNDYINTLPRSKQIFLWCVDKRMFFIVKILSSLHHVLAKLKRLVLK